MERSPDLFELLKDCLPDDHSRQVSDHYYVEKLLTGRRGQRVLDLGCGEGNSLEVFRKYDRDVDWSGVDIESSPEVDSRKRTDGALYTFDGVRLPFAHDQFDLIYSHQVFEHVRHPEQLLPEVTRTLRSGGAFIGSVSYLEPYHSFSYWNYTPFGWRTLLESAGLQVVELRPGIDSIAIIQRQYLGRPKEARLWFASSPLNEEIDRWGATTKRRAALINLRKLLFCGQIVFWARKP
jgi:SAM-dependent methyltransferase